MDRETKENLIELIQEGSQRKLRKIKKEDLISLVEEIQKENNEAISKLNLEVNDLKTEILTKDSIINNHKDLEGTLNEYKGLVQEIREKYVKSLDELESYDVRFSKLLKTCKFLRYSLFEIIALWVLTVIIILVL